MKKRLLMVAALAALSASAFGQGQVMLGNNSATLVRIADAVVGIPVPIGSTTFQLLSGPDAGSLTPLFPTAPTTSVVAGRIRNTIYFIPSAPNGQNAFFQIRAWDSVFASWNDALGAGAYVGQSVIFQSVTSFVPNPGDPPSLPVDLRGKYPGFALNPVPESSSGVLMVLGGMALFAIAQAKARKPIARIPAAKHI